MTETKEITLEELEKMIENDNLPKSIEEEFSDNKGE
jgi:hypothetical protein